MRCRLSCHQPYSCRSSRQSGQDDCCLTACADMQNRQVGHLPPARNIAHPVSRQPHLSHLSPCSPPLPPLSERRRTQTTSRGKCMTNAGRARETRHAPCAAKLPVTTVSERSPCKRRSSCRKGVCECVGASLRSIVTALAFVLGQAVRRGYAISPYRPWILGPLVPTTPHPTQRHSAPAIVRSPSMSPNRGDQ